ncbi:MAG TPA: hypothetical protein VM142_15395 [Acidimicrobiales bacterium]|nr:hypothetical protein [Acidimicrobiales bacterium]
MRTNRIRVLSASVAVVVVVLAPAIAGACVQARATLKNGQSAGLVGTTVGVDGTGFGAGPVEVRWNSRTGAKLGDATGPDFSVDVTIPEAPVGVHYIMVSQTLGSATSSVAFEVTEAPQSASPASGTSPTAGRTSSAASGADEDSPAAASAGATTQGSSGTEKGAHPTTAVQGSTEGGRIEGQPTASASTPPTVARSDEARDTAVVVPVTAQTTPSTVAAGAPSPATARAASANPAALTTASGQVVFGGSEAEAPSAPEPGVVSASAGTASGDTWSGFASETKPSLLLDDNLVADAAPNGKGSAPALGVGLLGSGMVAMFAGFAVAELRRKRLFAQAGFR